MGKEVTSRMYRIIEVLVLFLKEDRTLKDIARIMGISIRQVRYDINRINQIVEGETILPLIETDNKGRILIHDEEKLEIFYHNQVPEFKCSKEQRRDLLTVIIALDIHELNLNQLAKDLNVTRMTVKKDLDEAEKVLQGYHLQLVYQQRFQLIGEEEDIYEYRCFALSLIEYTLYKEKYEKIEFLLQQHINRTFHDMKLRAVIPTISYFLEVNQLLCKDAVFYWLCSNVLLMVWYQIKGFTIPDEKHREVVILPIDFRMLFDDLDVVFNFHIEKNTRDKISKVFSAVCNQEDVINAHIEPMVVKYIFHLFSLLDQHAYYQFKNDEVLLKGVYYHLKRCYVKQKAEIVIPTQVDYQIDIEKDLSDLLDTFCVEHQHFIDVSSSEECKLLKLHFANSISKTKSKTKKVCIISGASLTAKNQLCRSLEMLFEIEIVQVMSRYNIPFTSPWQDIDVLLFTEEIPEYFSKDISAIRINIVLTEEDLIHLNQLHFMPRKHVISLQKIYQGLEFLNAEDKLQTMQVFHQCLKNSFVMDRSDYFIKVNTDDMVFDDSLVMEDATCFHLHDHFSLSYCQHSQEQLVLHVDYEKKYLHLKILAKTPVRILQLLLTYRNLKDSCLVQNICDYTPSEILYYLNSF